MLSGLKTMMGFPQNGAESWWCPLAQWGVRGTPRVSLAPITLHPGLFPVGISSCVCGTPTPPHPTWHTGIVPLPTKRAEEGSWASPAPTSLGAGGIGALSGALGGQDLCHGNYPLTKQATEKAHGHFSPLCLHSCSSGVGRQATSCKMEFNHKNLFMHLS